MQVDRRYNATWYGRRCRASRYLSVAATLGSLSDPKDWWKAFHTERERGFDQLFHAHLKPFTLAFSLQEVSTRSTEITELLVIFISYVSHLILVLSYHSNPFFPLNTQLYYCLDSLRIGMCYAFCSCILKVYVLLVSPFVELAFFRRLIHEYYRHGAVVDCCCVDVRWIKVGEKWSNTTCWTSEGLVYRSLRRMCSGSLSRTRL